MGVREKGPPDLGTTLRRCKARAGRVQSAERGVEDSVRWKVEVEHRGNPSP